MVKLFIGLGLLLFLGGIGAALYGLPYLVLEYGFTFVIGGIVAATGGLVLIGIGVVLKEVRRVGLKLAASPAEAPVAATDDTPVSATDVAETPKPDPQGDLFAPGVAARVAVATATAGGATIAIGRISPFDKIERALEDVLETTRGEAKAAVETGEDAPQPVADSRDAGEADEAGIRTLSFADGEERTQANDSREEDDLEGDDLPGAAPLEEPSPPDNRPVSSDEGVVRVYTIGDSSFTMYADGTIRADTPQGVLTFTTMDELKAYLDQRPIASSAKA